MAKIPCAVFWDIQNIGVPKSQSSASVVSLVRSSIINLYNLREIYFYCVCDVTKLPVNVGNPLTNQDVNIIQAYDYTKDSADIKILDLMRKFVENQGRSGCAIILLSGDGDYAGTLIDLKKLYNINIFVIRLEKSFSVKLESAANYTFVLANGHLQPVKSCGLPQFFVSFSRFPITRGLHKIKFELNGMTQPFGSIDQSAIEHENEVIIGFPSLELARRAVTRFNTARYHGTFLKAEIIPNPGVEIVQKMRHSCSLVNRGPANKSLPKRSKPLIRMANRELQALPDSQSSQGRLKRTLSEDFIPITSSNRTVITDCTVSSSTPNPLQPSSYNKQNVQATEKINCTRWVSLYGQRTDVKCPILIDLTGGQLPPFKDPRPQATQPSSSEPLVVDLTEDF